MAARRNENMQCARCNLGLSPLNKSPDHLCSFCQKELSPHHPHSVKYHDWVNRGKKREVHHTKKGRVKQFAYTNAYAHVEEPKPNQYDPEFRGQLSDISLLRNATGDFLLAALDELEKRTRQAEDFIAKVRTAGGDK